MNQDSARTAVHDCWNRIGVRGDRSCPELQAYIHCRNCPVHAAAARVVLDAPAPAETIDAATRYIAHTGGPENTGALATDARSGMIFRLQAEWFSLPTRVCREVADLRPIHSLPHRRSGEVLGVTNIRGELLVCLSLSGLLGLQESAAAGQDKRKEVRRLLVIEHTTGAVVFPVDDIHGVERYRTQQLKEIPATLARAQTRYTTALLPLKEKAVGLLDEQPLFHAIEQSLA